MPLQAYCSPDAGDCLARIRPRECNYETPSQPPSAELLDNGLNVDRDIDVAESNNWWTCDSARAVFGSAAAAVDQKVSGDDCWIETYQQRQEMFALQPYDTISDQMFLDDAPFEVDETSLPILESSSPKSTPRYPQQNGLRRPYRGYSSLSISEERELLSVAMPSYVLPDNNSPDEDAESPCPTSPSSQTRNKKKKKGKRKLSRIAGKTEAASNSNAPPQSPSKKKLGHNAVEKRYRTNLNDKIAALQQCLPGLRILSKDKQAAADDALAATTTPPEEDAGAKQLDAAAQKCGKAEILMGAVDYIALLKGNVERLSSETAALNERLAAFERLAAAGSIALSKK